MNTLRRIEQDGYDWKQILKRNNPEELKHLFSFVAKSAYNEGVHDGKNQNDKLNAIQEILNEN